MIGVGFKARATQVGAKVPRLFLVEKVIGSGHPDRRRNVGNKSSGSGTFSPDGVRLHRLGTVTQSVNRVIGYRSPAVAFRDVGW
jgi:hypothetical protein